MNNPKGTIVSLDQRVGGLRAVIDIDVSAACPRCAAGKGCGAGLLTAGSRIRRVEVSVDAGLDLAAGDVVELSLAPDNLLRAALIVYGLPLAGAIIAAGIAFMLRLGDAAAATAALVGVASGLLASRLHLQRARCLRQFVPNVVKLS